MLMGLGVKLPKTIFGHGWWLAADGDKMSKSKGNAVKPLDMKNIVGVDGLRYFLTRDINFGNDAAFSPELVVSRVNSDLANNLGNLLSRVTNLVDKNFNGAAPEWPADPAPETKALLAKLDGLAGKVKQAILDLAPQQTTLLVLDVLNDANKYIGDRAPWKQVKTDLPAAAETLGACLEVLRVAGILLSPIMPGKCESLLNTIGYAKVPAFADAEKVRAIAPGTKVQKAEPLFMRVDWKPEA
jgi:methionyl-tRNA synthetase